MTVQVEESNNQKGKSKKKIENGFKYGMIFVIKCGRIIMLWSDFILFILVGCVMDFFWFHIIKTFMLQLFLFGMHTPSSYFVLNIIYILLSFCLIFLVNIIVIELQWEIKRILRRSRTPRPTSGGHNQCRIYYLRYLQMRLFMETSNPTHLNMHHMLK